MPATVVDAVQTPYPCACNCHAELSLDERAAGITALYRFDDAMRGWGQTVIWDLAAPTLWKVQQQLGNQVKWVAVRDGACIHRRLLGFCVHELIHAMCGDPEAANYGTPVGLPYGVPVDVTDEAAYLHPFNQHEARAWVGLDLVAYRLFGIDWSLLGARDVGTYGFPGGNALPDAVPDGYRKVAHYDRVHHQRRYYALADKLETEARDWFTTEKLDEIAQRFAAAEAIGKQARPSPREMARIRPKKPGRNDLCVCGSMRKWKACCGAAVAE